MAKQQDPPGKKPNLNKALNLPSNSRNVPLSPYYQNLMARNLMQKDTESYGMPPVKDFKQAKQVVRNMYENDVDVNQIVRLKDKAPVARQKDRESPGQAYYTSPERGFLPMFTEEYSQTLDRIASGLGKMYTAATDGVDGLKKIREFEKNSGMFDYGARHNAMLASDDFSMSKFGKDLGGAMGQLSVQIPAGAIGSLAGPMGSFAAAGLVTAPFIFGTSIDDALENGIADNHVIPYAIALTGIITTLELFALRALTKNIGINKIVSEAMQEATKKGLLPFGRNKIQNELSETLLSEGANISKGVLGGVFKSAKNRIIDRISAGAIIKGAAPEGFEEFASSYAEAASKLFYDSNFGAGTAGKGKFGMDKEKIASWSQFKDALYAGAIGMIAGSPVAAVSSATQPVYKTGLFHAFDGTIRNGGSIADAVSFINQSLDNSAGTTKPDGSPAYTPEQVQQAKNVVERAARTYERVGNRIQDPGFRFMVFNKIGEIDSLNEKSQALQSQKQFIEQAIANGQADLSIYSTDIKEIDNEINRIAEIVQYDTGFVTQAVNQYFDRELSMSQAMKELADSGVDDVIANLPSNLTPDAMIQFLRDTESSWKQGRVEIEAKYATPVQVGVNTTSEVTQQELDSDFEVMDLSLPSGPGATGSYTIARRVEEDPNTGDPIESYYTVSSPTQDGDMVIRGLRKIPRAKIYQDRLSSAFESRQKFESVARSIASGSTLTQEESDIYDDFKGYIDPIVSQLEQGEADVANSALESSVRSAMLESIDKDVEVYELAQNQIQEIDKALEPYADVDPATLTKGQQELIDTLRERRGNLSKLVTSYDDAITSVTTEGLIDPISLMDTNPVAYRLFMKMKEEFDALKGEAATLMGKKNKKDADRTKLTNLMERLKQFPGFEISYIQLQKEVELRESIAKLVTEAKVTSDNKKMRDLVKLSLRREQLQKQLQDLQNARNNKAVSENAAKIQGMIDSVLKSKTQVNSLTANQQRLFDAAIKKIEAINPDLSAELRAKVDKLFATKINQEVNDKVPEVRTSPEESGSVQSDTGVLPVDSGVGQVDAAQQDNSGEVQGRSQQADTGTAPVSEERSGGKDTPKGVAPDASQGSQAPVRGVGEATTQEVQENPALRDVESIKDRNEQTEAKIKNKGLFLAEYNESGDKIGDSVGEIISQSDVAPIATLVREKNGFEFVEFSNPQTGQVDVIVTGDTKGNYVGFYRLYENGKPTNKWSSKMNSKDKNAFKTMMSGVQEMLPQGHEYSEKTSISTDGLRIWNQQLQRGYELQYDNNGKLITDTVAINGDALVNELGINVNQGNFDNIRVSNKEDFNKVKKALLPYLEKFNLNESNINWVNGTVEIDLPVLRKSESFTGVLPVDSGAGQVDAAQQDNSSEVQGGGQQVDTGTAPVSEERSGGQDTPQGAAPDASQGSQAPVRGVEEAAATPGIQLPPIIEGRDLSELIAGYDPNIPVGDMLSRISEVPDFVKFDKSKEEAFWVQTESGGFGIVYNYMTGSVSGIDNINGDFASYPSFSRNAIPEQGELLRDLLEYNHAVYEANRSTKVGELDMRGKISGKARGMISNLFSRFPIRTGISIVMWDRSISGLKTSGLDPIKYPSVFTSNTGGIYYPSENQSTPSAIFLIDNNVTTLFHEYAHAIEHEYLYSADEATKDAIGDEYIKWYNKSKRKSTFSVARSNDISLYPEGSQRDSDIRSYISNMSNDRKRAYKEYRLSFSEWFADKAAQSMITKDRGDGNLVTQFFDKFIDLVKEFHRFITDNKYYSPSIEKFLDGIYVSSQKSIEADVNSMEAEAAQQEVQENPALRDVESTAQALSEEGVLSKVVDRVGNVFYTGRGKKYEDLSKTKADFIFFSQNKDNSSWYGGDESNVTEAFIDDSQYLDLTSQSKKTEFVDNNVTDDDVIKLYRKEIDFNLDRDRFGNKTKQDLVREYRERLRENRFSGDGKEQQFLLQRIKDLGFKGVRLLDSFFGRSDISTIAIDKSTITTVAPKSISEAYHKAKSDDSNPMLVSAVEGVLSDPQSGATQETPESTIAPDAITDSDQPVADPEPLDDTTITQEEQDVQAQIDQVDQEISEATATQDDIPQPDIDRAIAETRVESDVLDTIQNPTTTAGRLRALARSMSSESTANKLDSAAQALESGVQAVVNMKSFKKGVKNPFFLDTDASLNTGVFQALSKLGLSKGQAADAPILPGYARIIFDPKSRKYSVEFTPKGSDKKLSVKDLSVSDLTVLLTNNDGSPLSIFEKNQDGSLVDASQRNASTNTQEDLRDVTSFVKYLSMVFPSLNVQLLTEDQWVEKGFNSISDGAFDESGTIFLRRDYMKTKTLIHEMGHAVVYALKNSTDPIARGYYDALVKKIKGSKYYDHVKDQRVAATEEVYIDESIAVAIETMGFSLSKYERTPPKTQGASLFKKNFFELVQGAGRQILKAIGVSSTKNFDQITLDEILIDIAFIAVGLPDKTALASYLDLQSVGKYGSSTTLNSLFENFKRKPHHGDAASIKPPGYFLEFHRAATRGGTNVKDATEFFLEITTSGAPKGTMRDGLTMVQDNPMFAVNGKVPNVKLFDRLTSDPAFLDDFINDYVDLTNGIDVDSAPRTGIPSSTLLDNVDKMSASYHKWYSKRYIPIVENRRRAWAKIDPEAEAKTFSDNIKKISNPAGYDAKTKMYGRLVKTITGSSVSQFMNFSTLSKIFGGVMLGIDDMRMMNNEEAALAGNDAKRAYDEVLNKLQSLRKERGMAYDPLNEDVELEFYDNMSASGSMDNPVQKPITSGQAMSVWMTYKSQVAYYRKTYNDRISNLNDLIKTRESEIAAIRAKAKTSADTAKIKSIEKSIESARKSIKSTEAELLNVDTMSSLYYDPKAEKGRHGSATLIDSEGKLESRGFTLSYTAGNWLFEPSSSISGTKNDHNILMTKDQINKLRDMFEGEDSPYGKEFDLVWGFYNSDRGKQFFGRVNEVHHRMTGKYAEFIEDGYYHVRAYSGISTNERTIGASADSLRYIMERKSLPPRVIGIDVLSQMREYIEQNVYYMENAEVAMTLHNVMQQIPSDKLTNTSDGAFNDRVNQYYQSFKNAHESMRDHPQRRNRAMKEMRLMGIRGGWYNALMQNFARSVFAFNLAVPFKQLGTLFNLIGSSDLIASKHIWSVAPFMIKEGFRSYKSLATTEGGKLDKLLGIPQSLVETEVKWMQDHESKGFATILARIYDQTSNTQGVDLGEIGTVGIPKSKGLLGTGKAVWANVGETIDKYGMEPMRRNDRVVIIGIVMAAKKQVQENINNGHPDYVAAGATDINSDYAVSEVARIATEMTYKSNNMNMVNDKTPVQNSVDLLTRAISLFSSQPQKIFNSLKQSGIEAAQADFKDETLNRVFMLNVGQGVLLASVYQAAVTAVWDIMKNGYDEEEDYAKNMLIDTSRNIIGMAPSYFTEVVSGVISTFDNKPWTDEVGGMVLFDIANDAIRSIQSFNDFTNESTPAYIREREQRKFIVGLTNSMSRVLGAPITLTSWARKEFMDKKEGGN